MNNIMLIKHYVRLYQCHGLGNVVISREALEFLRLEKKLNKPHIVIYRGILNLAYGYNSVFTFTPKVKVEAKRPNEYFIMYDDCYAIPIWIEKGLLAKIEKQPILISMKKNGLFKGLKLEIGIKVLNRQ
jgi:hypothetical protein